MSKQLLIDHSVFQPTNILRESIDAKTRNTVVIGLVQACDKPNANKRIYPYDVLYPQVEKYVMGPIAENRALGELDHPESSIINLKNVSHNILELWWKGKDLYGKVEILPTPSGNILKELFLNNITVGISSRALGSTTQIGEGLVRVEEDLDIICWDFVSQPSTYGAYMRPQQSTGIGINESVNFQQQETKYSKANQLMRDLICEMSGVCCIN
jgi:hypothetical protein